MIENIYTNTAAKEEGYPVTGKRPPKNVRQVGNFSGDLRIYLEDYVQSFTRWLAEQDYSKKCMAVLVGEFAKSEHTRDVYAYGAIVVEDACVNDTIEMGTEHWTKVYEAIKEYFPDGEIVGWFFGGTSFSQEQQDMLCRVHLDHFAGSDRILMRYDCLEREEEFYRFENGELSRQTGYYIYYEKNIEMQNYMVEKKQGKASGERGEDTTVKEVRKKLGVAVDEESSKENTERREEKTDSGSRFLYAVGIVIAAIAVVSGASMIYNQERLKGFEQTLNQIMGAVEEKTDNAQDKEGMTAKKNNSGNIFENPPVQETFQNSVPSADEEKPTAGAEPDGMKTGETQPADTKTEESGNSETKPTEQATQGEDAGAPSDMTGDLTTEDTGEKITPIPSPADNESGEPADSQKDESGTQESGENTAKEEEGGNDADEEQNGDKESFRAEDFTIYIVQPGDTLVGICMKRYGNLEQMEFIKTLNQLNNENLIYAYQELLVP